MSWDAFQERMYLESQLERKLQFFFFFFVGAIVISLIISQKEAAMIFLVVSVIAIWLLAVSLWFFVNRINSVDKSLAASGAGTGPKFMERTLRFFLAKVLPVACAVILTSFLIVGISGVADSILPYKQKVVNVVESGIEKGKDIFDGVGSTNNSKKENHFESVDSVIEKGKTAPSKSGSEIKYDKSANEYLLSKKDVSGIVENQTEAGVQVKPAPKKVSVIYPVDGSHQAPKQANEDTRENVVAPSQNEAQVISPAYKPDPNFTPIERVIEKTPAEPTRTASKLKPTAVKVDTIKKKVAPNPHFKEIDKVIKK